MRKELIVEGDYMGEIMEAGGIPFLFLELTEAEYHCKDFHWDLALASIEGMIPVMPLGKLIDTLDISVQFLSAKGLNNRVRLLKDAQATTSKDLTDAIKRLELRAKQATRDSLKIVK